MSFNNMRLYMVVSVILVSQRDNPQMVRTQRKAQGLRQEDVANATGFGRQYVVKMESGKPILRIGLALMIARFLGIVPVVVCAQSATTGEDLPEMFPDDSPPLGD